MKNFDCSLCSSLCCITPPMLEGEEELKKAKEYGVRIIATKIDESDNGYYASIAKNHHGVCPFVSERGCRIYGNNFKVCSDFSCKAKEKSVQEVRTLKPIEFFNALSASSNEIRRPKAYSYEMIRKYGIEIVSREEAIELVNVSNLPQMAQHMIKIYAKIQI